ncbi:MAG: hypothetical protein ACTHLX_17700 [Candidatus Binatia bacterium]
MNIPILLKSLWSTGFPNCARFLDSDKGKPTMIKCVYNRQAVYFYLFLVIEHLAEARQ